jgi:pimeloyl-ACP methyl ester carboxylesterase
LKLKLSSLFKTFFLFSFILFFTVNNSAAVCSHVPLLEALAAMEGDAEVTVTTVPVGAWGEPDYYYELTPVNVIPTGALILYPGGNVDIRAYAPHARDIAAAGYLVVLIPVPDCLCIFQAGRSHDIVNAHPEIDRWSIGGHSFGGVCASWYLPGFAGKINGLVLWDTVPPGSMLSYGIKAVSIYRQHGEIAPNYYPAIPNMPADTVWVGVEGAIHEYFGWYGDNATDYDYFYNCCPERPPATISREEAQEIITDNTISFLASLKPDTINGTITGAVPGLKVDLVSVGCGFDFVYDTDRTNSEGYYSFESIPQGFYRVLPKSLYVNFDPLYGTIQIPQTEVQFYDFTAMPKN